MTGSRVFIAVLVMLPSTRAELSPRIRKQHLELGVYDSHLCVDKYIIRRGHELPDITAAIASEQRHIANAQPATSQG